MASQFNIISLTTSGMSKPVSLPDPGKSAAPDDAFSALVGKAAQDKPTPPAANDSKPVSSGQSSSAGVETGSNQKRDQDTGAAEQVAGAAAITGESEAAVTPGALADFIDALGALRDKLEAGELLDPESLAELEAKLTELGEALGLDISTLPIPEDFAALLANIDAEPDGLTGTLLQLLAPLAQSLAGQQPAADTAAPQEQLAAQLKSLGEKLGALLSALENGEVPAEKLAAAGMSPDLPIDAEIEAALARFAAKVPAEAPQVADEPELASPALKLNEPALTGKTEDAGSSATTGTRDDAAKSGIAAAKPEADTKDEGQSAERRAEQRPAQAAAAAPAPVDASGAPAPSQTSAQPDAIRLDAAANPRVIQSGYQTSQQQLNLPQIAFELARQAGEGNTRFQIRLDPPELGRIDVRLDIDTSGRVNARLTVDRAETLDLMQRDQRALERALQQAGLDGNKTNLEFSLKQNPFSGGQQGQDQAEQRFALPGAPAEEVEDLPPTVNLYRGSLQASGLDIIA